MPLSLSGSGSSTQLKLNYGFGLNLDSNNKLQIDTSVLGLNSSDGGSTWKIGLPNLPTLPGILIIPGSGGGSTTASIDYSKIQEPIQVVAPILLAADKKKQFRSTSSTLEALEARAVLFRA